MATLVAIGYPDEATAEAARQTVAGLEEDLIIQADQVAAIRRDTDGKYHITTTHGGASSGGGAVWGGFWGFLFGLIFFIPFAGLALGAGLGAPLRHLGGEARAQEVPGPGARPGAAGYVGALHDHRAGDARQGDRGAQGLRRHRDQDLPLGGGHAEAPGGADADGAGRRRLVGAGWSEDRGAAAAGRP